MRMVYEVCYYHVYVFLNAHESFYGTSYFTALPGIQLVHSV